MLKYEKDGPEQIKQRLLSICVPFDRLLDAGVTTDSRWTIPRSHFTLRSLTPNICLLSNCLDLRKITERSTSRGGFTDIQELLQWLTGTARSYVDF
ncbi:hypothetical protein CBM2637_A200166 [Cupriavidus taiwanensis]|nr:hypothetical protein CBM2637_A200166 [Cupriavidus taiwanensis]